MRLFSLLVAVAMSSCASTQGPGGVSDALLKPLGLETSDLTDSFSAPMREVRHLVDAGKLDDAELALLKNTSYFSQRLADKAKPLPSELQKLGEHIWGKHFAARTRDVNARVLGIASVLDRGKWAQQASDLRDAKLLTAALDSDFGVNALRQGQAERRALAENVHRVDVLVASSRAQALALTFVEVLSAGAHDASYPGEVFEAKDYVQSAEFQGAAQQRMSEMTDRAALVELSGKLKPYLSEATKQAIDKQFADHVKRELLADGHVSLEEMSTLAGVKTPFGTSADSLADVVRVGYVDLTSASFKNRNIFDFEITFKNDLALTFKGADESVFKSADWGGYDYLFVTDLALAKVAREFKSKKPVKSRAQTGERQQPNPGYITAMSAYQQAMAEYQRTQISAAMPKACSGWGCVLQSVADGLAQGAAQSKMDAASNALAGTSQMLTIPVYSEYTYQSVDISATKTADVNYYVIDTKGRRILRSNFEINDHEAFNVAYNVRDEDPDKASILRNLNSEEDVTQWEKRSMEVKLSALFKPENLRSTQSTPLTDVATFLASLSNREAVPASPTYARADAGSTARPQDPAFRDSVTTSPASAQTIADERFDSIVLIQNPGSTGTGFYVTPELVLTAHHVVEKNALIQMIFYDGTKTFGRVVDHDIRLDLALVRAQTAGKPLKIHTGPLRLGETVEAIGHPKGYEFTITRGVISAVRRQRSASIGSDALVEFVQTDTPISPGNSGGPLLLRDTVIGVNDWIRVDKGSQNLNFSVSYNEIRSFLDRFTAK